MRKKILLYTFLALSVVFAYQKSTAQCGTAGKGTNGTIYCMYPDTVSNCLYVGGGFKNSGNYVLNYCCYWDNSNYFPMKKSAITGCNDSVWCFTYYNGNLYVGGDFTYAGGVACNHIARWDGNTWYPVGNGFNNSVHSLIAYNNELYAGGEFTASGATPVKYLSKWKETQWVQIADGTNDDVEAMCIWNNTLFIGGDFTLAGIKQVNHLCKWDGTNISGVGNGFSAGMMNQCMVHSLCVYNGNLFAGGMFENSGPIELHYLAMWNGSTWSSLGDIGGAMMGDNAVSAMCVYNDQLCIGGNFSSCGLKLANNLAMWNGSNWSNIGTGVNGTVNSLAVFRNELYIAGSFSSAAGTAVNNIAKYSVATGIQPLQPNTNSLNVYPNPASDFLIYSWFNEKSSFVKFSLYDKNGNIIMNKNSSVFSAGLHQESISINNLSKGIYFLSLKSDNRILTTKIEIIK